MSLFALSDTHLSLYNDKPMDIFGNRWQSYAQKLDKGWKAVVTDKDTVVIAGDVSWGISLEEAKLDLQYIDSLPGKKIISKGNHDYWWSTASKINKFFEENNISFEHMPSGIDTLSVFVHQEEFEGREQHVLSTLHRLAKPDSIEIDADLALVAVVGRGMRSNRGVAARVLASLAHQNINVKMIDQGSSELNIILGVKNSDFETAIKAIYDIFVTTRL